MRACTHAVHRKAKPKGAEADAVVAASGALNLQRQKQRFECAEHLGGPVRVSMLQKRSAGKGVRMFTKHERLRREGLTCPARRR